MVVKLLVGMAVSFVSISCAAQVVPTAHASASTAVVGVGMNYWSGDWGSGNINRWGPSTWATVTVWRDFSIIAEGHSMFLGGNANASNYKYFAGGGGLSYTLKRWSRFQPSLKAEAGYASLSHPPNGTGHLHDSGNIWTLGGGFEYHTYANLWTSVGYSYDFFPNFGSYVNGQKNGLNPRGFTFGMTYRFGPSGSRF
jgi:hypothetical protein